VSGQGAAFAVLAALLAAVVFANDWGVLAFDTKPELYEAPWRTLARELQTWRAGPHLGQPNYHLGFAPVVAVVAALRSLGAEPWVAARVLRLALLLLAAWGTARFVDRLAGGRADPVARVVAATVAVANPYVVVSGSTLPVLLPYAFLPWLLAAFVDAVRDPRAWRPPARFALAFFAAGGMNAGVVPLFQLLALPALAASLCLAERRRPAAAVTATLRCGLLAAAVSLYWLVPTVLAAGAGEAVAANTERPDAVALTSSWSESIRGLGMWTMYGQGVGRLPTSSFAAYLTNPAVIAATWALPAAAVLGAALSRARARLAPALLLAVAVPVMVGLHPPASSTPFGRALAWAFAEVPGAIAFRTTNKAGALWALAIAVLAGLGAAAAAARPGWTRAGVAVGGVAVLVGATAPAWTGDLHPTTLTVPAYWREAAAEVDAGDRATRVLFLPGQSLARYRWGHEGVDDLDGVLFDREVVWRPTVPAGSRAAANALAALDVRLNDGGLPPGALSAFARYLGAGEVLVRHDTEWERVGAARPAVLDAAVAAEPGLVPAGSYGPPGSTTVAPPGGGSLVRPDPAEAALPPLRRLAVADPRPVVRAEPAAGTLLVGGDGFAVPALGRAGLLDGAPPFRYLGDLDAPGLAAALADGGRVVLTDSNRRRTWDVHQAGRAHSPTLAAEDPLDPATSRTLFVDPDAQTVARAVGGTVSATASGSPFAPTPGGAPALAFDGDPSTAWTFGGFGTADGQSVTLRLPAPAVVSRLTLDPTREAGVRIAAVRVTLGRRSVDRRLPGDGAVTLDLPPTRTDTLRVEVTETRGAGQNPVGFREIAVPGVRVDTVARLPRTLAVLAAQLDSPGRAALAAAPLDVLLTREAGERDDPGDDEERRLDREVELPAPRTFTATGVAAAGPGLPDAALDRLAGADGPVRAVASSRRDGDVARRAAAALDGDAATGWEPDPAEAEPWLEVRFPAQPVTGVRLDQAAAGGIAEVTITAGDAPPVRAALAPGSTDVALPEVTADRLRITVVRRAGLPGEPERAVRLDEVAVGDLRIAPPDPGAALPCVPAYRAGGALRSIRLAGTWAELEAGAPLPFTGCDGPVGLGAGATRLRAEDGWLVDALDLRGEGAARTPGPAPAVQVDRPAPTAMTVRAGAATGSWWLVSGQAYDDRWTATLDGRDLGPPVLLDGYAAAWRVDAQDGGRIEVRYAPQRAAEVTRAASALALAACAALALRPAAAPPPWRRPRPAATRRRRQRIRSGPARAPQAPAAPGLAPEGGLPRAPDGEARRGGGGSG